MRIHTQEEKDKALTYIGKQYVKRLNKRNDIYTVEDVLFTYNSKGDLINIRFIAWCELMGQRVYVYDVVAVTILRNEGK